jgi:hypothetical protein
MAVLTYFYYDDKEEKEYYFFSSRRQAIDPPWVPARYETRTMESIRKDIKSLLEGYQVIEVLNPDPNNIPLDSYIFRGLTKNCVNYDKNFRWAISGMWPKEFGRVSYFGILEYCTSYEDAKHRFEIMKHHAENDSDVVKEKIRLYISKHLL